MNWHRVRGGCCCVVLLAVAWTGQAVRAGIVATGACCYRAATGAPLCAEVSQIECAQRQGIFRPGVLCSDIDLAECTVRTGACCLGNECVIVPESRCEINNGTFHGVGSQCNTANNICLGRCCLQDSGCAYVNIDVCFEQLHGIFFVGGEPCAAGSCPATGACCRGPNDCFLTSRELCIEFYQGHYGGDGSPCPEACISTLGEACCGPNGACTEMPVQECISHGGVHLGPGSHCGGDVNHNAIDDACETEKPCNDCGPGPHWVDTCPGGHDNMPSGALVGIDIDGDCLADTSVVLFGPVYVARTNSRDDSSQYPGLRSVDGHSDVIDTEMLSLNLSGGGMTLVAGAGYGHVALRPTRGAIAEQPSDSTTADSFFDVFFEIEYGGQLAYNHDPLRVESELTCLPPDAQYIHPTGCLPLYSKPDGGEFVANLVSANHFTYPGCCLGPECANIPPAACQESGGHVVPDCLADLNHNNVNDACEPPSCRPTPDGEACQREACAATVDVCQPKCATLNPATGQTKLEKCDCAPNGACHVEFGLPNATAGPGDCTVPDNGSGTAVLPPPGCPYLSPDQVHMIIDGLPPGTTIELATIHKDFICHKQPGGSSVCSFPPGVDCEEPGGSLGGDKECRNSSLQLNMHGSCTGPPNALCNYNRTMQLPVSFETHTGPRSPGDPVQSFDTEMFRLFGQITGDPDFDLLRIVAGTDFGLPSPGHTTLIRMPGGNWAVDSFFDITYRIDFVGRSQGPFGGMSGSTTGTIRMQTVAAMRCRGGCGGTDTCIGRRTVTPDGFVTLCCGCEEEPKEACCLGNGGCTETTAARCHEAGGQRLGAGSHCKGDNNNNGRDDACERDKPCSECGPGPHWVDQCPGGSDVMPSGAVVAVDTNLDCQPDTTLTMLGGAIVAHTGAMDDSAQFPGLRPSDGHKDVLDAEMTALFMSGGGTELRAGAGNAHVPIRPTRGAVAEVPSNSSLADSFFDVFFELDLGGGHYVYNHDAVKMKAEALTCLPPIAAFLSPTGCLPLYSAPNGGVLVANLIAARNETYPTGACCFRGGGCLDLREQVCLQEGGRPSPRGTSCDTVHCPKPGDLDHDGDVDVKDHVIFVECMKGPHVSVSGRCTEADMDGDGDVDMHDTASFFDVFTEISR